MTTEPTPGSQTERNRALVLRYFDALRSGDAALPDFFSDDASWWVPESSRLGGLHRGKQAVLALLGSGVDLYDPETPFEMRIDAAVAEGDRVAVQLVMEARTARGEPYLNHYHFAFRIAGDRICEVREYLDTLYAERKLFS